MASMSESLENILLIRSMMVGMLYAYKIILDANRWILLFISEIMVYSFTFTR